MRSFLLSLLFAACVTLAYSQSLTLDPHFGNDGIVKSNLFYAGGATAGRKTFVQPDGKLLIVLQEGNGTTLARFLSDGRFDASFFNEFDVYRSSTDVAYGDAAQDTTGRIVVVGTSNHDFNLTRYDTASDIYGSYIDLYTNIGFPDSSVATAVAIQPDGKIVVAGYSYSGGVAHFAVARCLADGTLDNSFSGDGKQVTSIGNNGAFATAIALQADGKIVVGGYAGGYGARRDFAVVRYNTDGSRDLTFSDDGKQLTTVGVYDDMANAVAIQADGKIVLSGRTQVTDGPSGHYAVATVRYNTNGSLDATFNSNGIAITPVGMFAEATSILVQSDAKIVIAGTVKTAASEDFLLLRYNSNGSLDASFGTGGKQTTDFNNGTDHASAALFTNGKILVTGWTDPRGNKLREIALARYTANGNLDVSFNGDGKINQYFSTGSTGYSGVAVLKDGKVLAVGGTSGDNVYEDIPEIVLARYNPDGSFDTSFGTGGKVVTDPFSFGASGNAFALQSDGKIIVGGDIFDETTENETEDFILVRYTANGSVDSTFGNNGIAYVDFNGSDDYLSSILIQPNGKIVAVGQVVNGYGDSSFMGVARLNSNGSLDGSFGGNGTQVIRVTGATNETASAVALQPDGKIVVAGATTDETTAQQVFAVARLNVNGSLDYSFSRDGKLTTSFGNFGSTVRANALAIQTDGKIVAAGKSNGYFTLVRYLANGNLDVSFSGDGKQTTDFGGDASINSILIQGNGKILAAGTGKEKFALAQYNRNGTLDSSFGVNGKQTTDIEAGQDAISGIALSGNRLYAAGTSTVYADFDRLVIGVVAAYRLDENTFVTKITKAEDAPVNSRLVVRAFPNPATQYFTLQTGSSSDVPLSVRVTDAFGRVVDVMQNRAANGTLQFGAQYGPGVYYAEVRQGNEIKIVKLVKQPG